jgi:hypothetical protein
VLFTLVLLAASPFHAAFSTFDQGHPGHAHSQVAAAQKADHDQSTAGLPSFEVSTTPAGEIADALSRVPRAVGGLRALRPILRL